MWVSLLVLAPVVLYFWLGGEDSTDSVDQPAVSDSDQRRPTPAGRDLAPRRLAPQEQLRTWDPENAYRQPPPQPDTGTIHGVYPTREAYNPQPAANRGYGFRPLTQREKNKLEQESVSTRPMAPTDPVYKGRPSRGYPASGYTAGDYPSSGLPAATYPRAGEMQAPPTPTYKFRKFDPDKATKRWTGNYSLPSQPPLPERNSPYAPGWSPPLPYQRGSFPNDRSLWAARALTP